MEYEFLEAAKKAGALPCPFCGFPAIAGVMSKGVGLWFHCSGKRTGGFMGSMEDCPGTRASGTIQAWNTRQPLRLPDSMMKRMDFER